MVVMQTSYFDQQRVEREKARRGPARGASAAPLAGPAPFRKEPRGRSILHLDLSRRPPSFCPGYQGRGVLFDPRAGRRGCLQGPLNPRWIPEGQGRAETGTGCSKAAQPRLPEGTFRQPGSSLPAATVPARGPQRPSRRHGTPGSSRRARDLRLRPACAAPEQSPDTRVLPLALPVCLSVRLSVCLWQVNRS